MKQLWFIIRWADIEPLCTMIVFMNLWWSKVIITTTPTSLVAIGYVIPLDVFGTILLIAGVLVLVGIMAVNSQLVIIGCVISMLCWFMLAVTSALLPRVNVDLIIMFVGLTVFSLFVGIRTLLDPLRAG